MTNSAEGPEPWGKLQRDAENRALAPRLSLVAHCIDVAAVVAALLELPTWQARLARLAGRALTPHDRARWCALAFLHDVGKAGAGFYSKGVAVDVAQAWRRQAHATWVSLGHVAVVGPLFEGDASCRPWRDALGVDEVLDWGADDEGREQVLALWLASMSHHGAPLTRSDLEREATAGLSSWTTPIEDYQPAPGLARLGAAVRQILPLAFAADSPPLTATPALVHAFAGLVSLADWIGSNTAPGFFPYDLAAHDETRWPHALQRAREALVAMRLDVEVIRADLQQRSPAFKAVFGFPPRAMQAHAGRHDLGPLVVIEAETGSGKTEAALWRFKTLFEAGEVDAMCFLLPTRVSATAIALRVQAFVERVFPDERLRPNTVLAVPGYLRANGRQGDKALAGFEVLWPEDVDPSAKPLYWAAEHSKRYFAAACATGTIDQFLLSVLQSKHAHLRGTVLLRSLVIVDEVHASDAYMTALLRAALQRHAGAGGHGLLMSATLTGEARAGLLQAGQTTPRGWGTPAASASPDAPYPCVSDAGQLLACERTATPKRIQRALLPAMRDPVVVAEQVAAAVAAGARVLVIRNTVAQAVATQLAIEARLGAQHPALFRLDGVVAMHHGRYAFEDRRRLDEAVELAFGKPAMASREPHVLVGTQTLEISLDCDADLMVTDLVPIDVLLQRLGRLHRHRERDKHRPAGFTEPRVLVLTPPDRDLGALLKPGATRGLGIGSRSAYTNLLAIEATWRLLEDTTTYPVWSIPDHNRVLVEAGADSQRLMALADQMGGGWPKFGQDLLGKRAAEAGQASPVLVRWSDDWNDAHWSDLGDQVRTRLGLDGIDLDLLQPWTSPFGQPLIRLTVPSWMLPALAGAKRPPLVEQQQGDDRALTLQVADRSLHYDRLGLRAG